MFGSAAGLGDFFDETAEGLPDVNSISIFLAEAVSAPDDSNQAWRLLWRLQ